MDAKPNPNIRCRMAPSPTGPLHLGTARTTLTNWLFARANGGNFVMRIEDTDTERSKPEFEKDIIDGLRRLGLDWDEGPDVGGPYGPYRQSERLDLYEKYLKILLEKGSAYYCYCTKEELDAERTKQEAAKQAPRYSGRCRTAPPTGREPQVIRFKTPEERLAFNDMIRGRIEFDLALSGDIVIAKNTRSPLYNFAVVVDDSEMKISHIIRGEEHIANTPKQIAMQRALGFETPKYAHLPLILNPDRSKLSKRFVETSMSNYFDLGFLSTALMNFIALLGWHPKDDREILMPDDLIKEFKIERVQKAGAIFNEEKLEWLNAEHIKLMPDQKLLELLRPFLAQAGVEAGDTPLLKLIEIEKTRMKTLRDFSANTDFFFAAPEYKPDLLIWKDTPRPQIKTNFEAIIQVLGSLPEHEFTRTGLETALKALTDDLGRGEVLWPLRVALSGKKASPGPFEILWVMGKDEALRRVKAAIKAL